MGNAAAHEGDAVTDADIYLSGQRNDIDLFIDLYGVRPETAAEFEQDGRWDLIGALNTMATLKSRLREKRISPIRTEVHEAFRGLINALENHTKDQTRITSALAGFFWRENNTK